AQTALSPLALEQLTPSANHRSPILDNILIYVASADRGMPLNQQTRIYLVCKAWLSHWDTLICDNFRQIVRDPLMKHVWRHLLACCGEDQVEPLFQQFGIAAPPEEALLPDSRALSKCMRLFCEFAVRFKQDPSLRRDPEELLKGISGTKFQQFVHGLSRIWAKNPRDILLNLPQTTPCSPIDPNLLSYLQANGGVESHFSLYTTAHLMGNLTLYSFIAENSHATLKRAAQEREADPHRSPKCKVAIGPTFGDHFDISRGFCRRSLPLPSEVIYHFPEEILLFSNLCVLSIVEQRIDTLPESIAQLTSLHFLCVRDCGLRALNANLGEMTTLSSLDLSNNSIAQLPDSIGHLSALIDLNLKGNPLLGIPPCISQLTNLGIINLSAPRSAHYSLHSLHSLPRLWHLNLVGWPSSAGEGFPSSLTLWPDHPNFVTRLSPRLGESLYYFVELDLSYRNQLDAHPICLVSEHNWEVITNVVSIPSLVMTFFTKSMSNGLSRDALLGVTGVHRALTTSGILTEESSVNYVDLLFLSFNFGLALYDDKEVRINNVLNSRYTFEFDSCVRNELIYNNGFYCRMNAFLNNDVTRFWNGSWWQPYAVTLSYIGLSELAGRVCIWTDCATPQTIRRCSRIGLIFITVLYNLLPILLVNVLNEDRF
ncbi:MAG: leucine-rich repeat domain-containing protein, partial [Chlamydiia bacterium]|nr:leucine-rich repeat domain-containing protein [Chlamydiia bacterium]